MCQLNPIWRTIACAGLVAVAAAVGSSPSVAAGLDAACTSTPTPECILDAALRTAEEHFDWDREGRAIAYSQIASAQAIAGDPAAASASFRAAIAEALGADNPDTRAGLIRDVLGVQSAAGFEVAALSIAMQLDGYSRVIALSAIANGEAQQDMIVAARIHFNTARGETELLDPSEIRWVALLVIAFDQMESGLLEDVRETIRESLQLLSTNCILWDGDCSSAFAAVGALQARVGLIQEAHETIALLERPGDRETVTTQLVRTLAHEGRFDEAVLMADGMSSSLRLITAFSDIAEAQMLAGDIVGALSSFETAVTAAVQETALSWRSYLLVQVATAQARAGLINDARRTMGLLPEMYSEGERRDILVGIAKAHAAAGSIGSAMLVIGEIEASMTHLQDTAGARVEALVSIALALLQ